MVSIASSDQLDQMPVVRDRRDFNPRSGNWLERLIFNHRAVIIVACAMITVLLGYQSTKLVVNANFDRMIPQTHPYIQNYFDNRDDLKHLGNSIRIVVESTDGDIWNKDYLHVLQKVNDALFLTPGVYRPYQRSLWMSLVRWNEVTDEGFKGGPVMPPDYDGSQKSIDQLRVNVARAGITGTLVANDFRSSMVVVPLIEQYADTGKNLDYGKLNQQLEQIRAIQDQPLPGATEPPKVKIHIVGFAKIVGDLIEGLAQVILFFGAAILASLLIIFLYTRCIRSTFLIVSCSLMAVTWQLGILQLLGYELDPYSVLVPFLVFAIGVSHGTQKMNGIMQDVGRGTHKYVAARYTFRRLFMAGITALAADVVGFAVLMIIDVPVIQNLALSASIGVAILTFTCLILLPILLSYTGVSPKAAARSLRDESATASDHHGVVANFFNRFTERRWAIGAISIALVLGIVGYVISLQVKVGDLDAGAPELRADSRYNLDNTYVNSHYSLSSDQFVVMAKTPPGGAEHVESLMEIDRLEWALRQLPGVQTTESLAGATVRSISGMFEGLPKWRTISYDQGMVGSAVFTATDRGDPNLISRDGSMVPVVAYLVDHKANTLESVLKVTETFAAEHNSDQIRFLPAAGSAGIEAITNIVVKDANRTMLLYVYIAVIVLCFISFRNWRAVVIAVLPLILTSILAEALMVMLGIGIKVATLPVVALGVGIGVDYALYLLSVQLNFMRNGESLATAYGHTIRFTGRIVALVGCTLAAGVVTWVWSPIKFQADMGILLTFMFLWNMIGALILIPALSHFLLKEKPA